MKLKKLIQNKNGASMLDYFILSMVSLLIGSSVFMLGAEVKKGVDTGKGRVSEINKTLEKNG